MKKFLKPALLWLFSALLFLGLNYYFDILPLNFRFLSENLIVDLTTPGQARVKADFSFKNLTALGKSLTLFYPFHLKGGHQYPVNLKIYLNGKARDFEATPNGILVKLDFPPRGELRLKLEFTQSYRGNYFKLILGYSRGWLQKIKRGEILLKAGQMKISTLSPPMNPIEEPGRHLYWLKRANYFDEGVKIQFRK